jgi:large subunit ribosomal protein L25
MRGAWSARPLICRDAIAEGEWPAGPDEIQPPRVTVESGSGHALHFAAVSGDRITLEVKERGADQLGTRNVKRLRRLGLIPGVLYGKANKAFVVGERELRIALTGPSGLHAIVDVLVDGQKTPHHAVLKDYQQHPVRGTITHIDFHEVRLDQPIQATVVVQLVGEAPGAKVGGVVQQVARELRVEALPSAIPEHIEVDLSSLELGESLRLHDVAPIAGVRFLDDAAETVIANCSSPRGLTEAEEAADEALAAEASAEAAAQSESAAPDEE